MIMPRMSQSDNILLLHVHSIREVNHSIKLTTHLSYTREVHLRFSLTISTHCQRLYPSWYEYFFLSMLTDIPHLGTTCPHTRTRFGPRIYLYTYILSSSRADTRSFSGSYFEFGSGFRQGHRNLKRPFKARGALLKPVSRNQTSFLPKPTDCSHLASRS